MNPSQRDSQSESLIRGFFTLSVLLCMILLTTCFRDSNHAPALAVPVKAARMPILDSLGHDSNIVGTRAIFHRIEPGKFKMGEIGDQVEVTLSQPFDMASALTTQIVWRRIADLANAKLGGRYKINVDPSYFKGATRPVEGVSYYDAQTWINALNDLSQAGESDLIALIPDHKRGAVYRLPTEAEWEFVIRGRGQYNEGYHFGNESSQLGDYAWYITNSGDETHPVGQKKPLVIDGNQFYDMIGNVTSWVADVYVPWIPGGTDPFPKKSFEENDGNYVLRGSCAWCADSTLRSAWRGKGWGPSGAGFRLARTSR